MGCKNVWLALKLWKTASCTYKKIHCIVIAFCSTIWKFKNLVCNRFHEQKILFYVFYKEKIRFYV